MLVAPVPPWSIGKVPARLVIAKEPEPLSLILSAVIVPVSIFPPSIVVILLPPTSENVPPLKVTTPVKLVCFTTLLYATAVSYTHLTLPTILLV